VSYHFTDVISFISRDQYIIFDPHSKFLSNNSQGLRTNFLENSVNESVCRDKMKLIRIQHRTKFSFHS
jgi:hypothetical protein